MSSSLEACNIANEVSHTTTGTPADQFERMCAPDADASRKIGVVVIGRNEGHRLSRSLASALNASPLTIYVDSGSTDGSVTRARNLGVPVVELCKSKSFSAARARNEGASALLRICPSLELIQFVDGDCELQPGWIENAAALMFRSPAIGAVSGRRREVNGIASMYNRLCDWEWDVPLGSTDFIGGDALVRVPAFLASGGYDEGFIAGEEIDLSIRLRARGWVLWRQEQEMTLHDAKILKFSQWWQRQSAAAMRSEYWPLNTERDPAFAASHRLCAVSLGVACFPQRCCSAQPSIRRHFGRCWLIRSTQQRSRSGTVAAAGATGNEGFCCPSGKSRRPWD